MKKLLAIILLTVSLNAQPFKFAAMSDSRGSDNGVNSAILSALANHLVTTQPEAKFLLFAGDLVNGNKVDPEKTKQELLHWKNVMKPIYENPNMIWPKIWLTVGNHEVQHRDDEKNFKEIFPNVFMNGPNDEKGLTYSFDYNQAHFVFVTSDRWYYGAPDDTSDDKRDWHYVKHLDWLENDLKSAKQRGAKWIFISSHEPAFPVGGHLRDALPNLGLNLKLPLDSTRIWYLNQRNEFWRILKENNVTAYVCGHEHLYARQSVEGVHQVIVGSCGAPLYLFNPKFGEARDTTMSGRELTYEESVPYYQALNYPHGPGENAQASEAFFGLRAFEYVIFDVRENDVLVQTFGAFPVEGKVNVMKDEIKLIDEFVIAK